MNITDEKETHTSTQKRLFHYANIKTDCHSRLS